MNNAMLTSLMDQAGAPAHPLIFLVLGVVTFALHIVAVQVMLGTLGLTLWGAWRQTPAWQHLSHTLMMTAKVAVGFAVVLGVAPLLFVQVIYDGFWYTSNVLSAWWLMAFIVILIVAYLGLYRAYGLNHQYAADGRPLMREGPVQGAKWLLTSLVLLLVCGFIIHAVTNQALFPGRWMNWYAPNGDIDPSGRALHYWHVGRLGFFLVLALPVTAAWLFGLRRYLLNRGETDEALLTTIESTAHRLGLVGGVLALVLGTLWMVTLPESMQWFRTSIWAYVGLIPLAFFVLMSPIQRKRRLCTPCNYLAFVMSIVMVIVLAALREVLRYGTLLHAYGWDALNYKVNMDWGSTSVFFATFLIIGVLNVLYLTLLAWRSGQTEGLYTPSASVNTLGRCAVLSLLAWVVLYFGIGITFVGSH